MNAPDIPNHLTASQLQVTASQPEPLQRTESDAKGLDDVAPLFPGMSVFHDLHISGENDTELLHAVSSLLRDQGVEIIRLTLRGCDSGQTCVKCRLSGLTSKDANALVRALQSRAELISARVEHVILKTG